MRRSPARLVLASTLPLALSACGPADEPNFTARTTFKTVQECTDAKVPVDVCSDAYIQAMADHRKVAPTYDDKAACDADFVPDYCQATSGGKWMPRLGGFELAYSGNLTKEQLAQANQAAASGSGGGSSGSSGNNGLLTGLLLGHVLSNMGNSVRYSSQPVYQTRDDRGGYYTSSLPGQIDRGKTFSQSDQARSSGSNAYTRSTLGRSLGSGSSVSSTVSRGGFGSQATARSGWGGKSSSSSSSFGG